MPLRDSIGFPNPDLKYETLWTNRGACLREARLTDYPQELGSETGVLLLNALADDTPSTLALVDPQGRMPLDTRNYEVLEESAERIAFTSKFDNGLRVTKEFFPQPNRYEIGVRVTFTNEGAAPQWARYRIIAAGRIVQGGGSGRGANISLNGAVGYRRNGSRIVVDSRPARNKRKFLVFNLKGLPYERTSNETEPIAWIGVANRYFAGVLQPVVPSGGSAHKLVQDVALSIIENCDEVKSTTGKTSRANNILASLTVRGEELGPGESMTHAFTYFLGPKDQKVLAEYPDMTKLLDYGMFGFISRILLTLLTFFHHIIPNYGVGIILLTAFVKVCLHPFTRKSQLAMHKMQKLQPLIREIQTKHKNDRQRASKEQMELFRKHGANPMSGCMPIFFQLPVFFGLFRMLQYSIAIRQEGFMLWINDLSQPDTIGHWGGMPINILPVLMVASWIGQQLTMPKPVDPQQAQTQKMMLFMPILFGFMLYGMASGLTLYWLTSTFLGIIEQHFIRRQIKKMEGRGKFPDAVPAVAQAKPRRAKSRRR